MFDLHLVLISYWRRVLLVEKANIHEPSMDVMKIVELGEKLGYKGEELRNFMQEEEIKIAEQAKQKEEWEDKLRKRDEKLQQMFQILL